MRPKKGGYPLNSDDKREARQLKRLQHTNDVRRLLRMWRKSSYADVRMAAIWKLKSQSALEHIALHERMSGLRCEAVKKLCDKALLLRITKEDEDEFVRFMARKKYEYGGSEPWDASELDEETAKEIVAFLEHNSELKCLATGEEDSEEWW